MTKTLYWGPEERVTPREFINRIAPLVIGPAGTMGDCNGDMFMSDYQKLVEAANRLSNRSAEK